MKRTEMWLGISLDEIERMKKSAMYNVKYFYPLIYHQMSRKDCIDFFKDNNFPVPIKSGCVFVHIIIIEIGQSKKIRIQANFRLQLKWTGQ